MKELTNETRKVLVFCWREFHWDAFLYMKREYRLIKYRIGPTNTKIHEPKIVMNTIKRRKSNLITNLLSKDLQHWLHWFSISLKMFSVFSIKKVMKFTTVLFMSNGDGSRRIFLFSQIRISWKYQLKRNLTLFLTKFFLHIIHSIFPQSPTTII